MVHGVSYMMIVHVLLLLHYAAWILDWYWCKILFITCFHDSLLHVMWNLLYDVLVVIIHHVMFWDPLLYDARILLFITCCHACVLFRHPFCAMLARCSLCMFLCHADRSLLIENSSCGISLRATPGWGNFSLYDHNIISCVHHHYWQHLMQQPTPY